MFHYQGGICTDDINPSMIRHIPMLGGFVTSVIIGAMFSGSVAPVRVSQDKSVLDEWADKVRFTQAPTVDSKDVVTPPRLGRLGSRPGARPGGEGWACRRMSGDLASTHGVQLNVT